MASPQTEDGYTAIANEIMEALIAAELSGQEFRIALLVIRKTYGFKKKEDAISLSQMCPSIRLVPTSAPAALPTPCWHCVFEPLCEHWKNHTLRRAHSCGSDSLHFKESQGVRASPGPPFTTSALAEAVEESPSSEQN